MKHAGGLTRGFDVGGVSIGREDLVLIAGPCAIESREQIERVAQSLHALGIPIMRGGAFKPRTSPHVFQGLGAEGLAMLRETADQYDLRVVTEVMDTAQVDAAASCADIIQVGARSMSNTCLLRMLGERGIPVLLKRGYSSTLEEFLLAAEHILHAGNPRVLLCERGIRTFENATRFTLDLSAVPVLKQRTGLPVVVDPSHAAGDASLVGSLAMASVAAGADAVMLEIHPQPERALCDARQSLRLSEFAELVPRLRRIRQILSEPAPSAHRPAAAAQTEAQAPAPPPVSRRSRFSS